MRKLNLASSVLIVLLPLIAAAQEYRGTILGRITDPTGSAVAGAVVEAININTNVAIKAESNEAGNYALSAIPGDYKVTIGHPGFKKVARAGIRLSSGTRETVDFSLELGTITESVTVQGESPLLNMATAETGQVVENQYVASVEFSGNRDALNLVYLSPGVAGTEGGTYTSATPSQFAVNGGSGKNGGNEVLVDGFPVAGGSGYNVYIPTLDEVEEVKVNTGLFDASLGRTTGGVISMTTKGGTNEPHGSVYFYKNPVGLQANGWDNNKYGNPRLPSPFWQWGLQTGGPVYIPKVYNGKNKTFYTFALEQDTIRAAEAPISAFPPVWSARAISLRPSPAPARRLSSTILRPLSSMPVEKRPGSRSLEPRSRIRASIPPARPSWACIRCLTRMSSPGWASTIGW